MYNISYDDATATEAHPISSQASSEISLASVYPGKPDNKDLSHPERISRCVELNVTVMENRKPYDLLFKLLLIGDSGVGKTCIIFR